MISIPSNKKATTELTKINIISLPLKGMVSEGFEVGLEVAIVWTMPLLESENASEVFEVVWEVAILKAAPFPDPDSFIGLDADPASRAVH